MRVPNLAFGFGGLVALSTLVAEAGEHRFEIGPRFVIVTAGGEPANDMMAPGIYGEYSLEGGNWFVGAAIDQYAYDFETPWKVVGLEQDPGVEVIDASADATVLSGWIGRAYGRPQRRLHWVWTAGLGFSAPSVDDVSGPVQGGGAFDLTTDPGTEIIVSATGGLRLRLGKRWSLQFGVRADRHFADWKVVDRVSGQSGAVDDYSGLGGHLGFGIRF